jgi:hypothetical protein
MKKTISIEFDEQSKAITARTKIEYQLESMVEALTFENNDMLDESKKLFNAAWEYANAKSIAKSGVHYK